MLLSQVGTVFLFRLCCCFFLHGRKHFSSSFYKTTNGLLDGRGSLTQFGGERRQVQVAVLVVQVVVSYNNQSTKVESNTSSGPEC